MTDTSTQGAAPAAPTVKQKVGWNWPDTRGWLALGGFFQVTIALILLAYVPIPAANHDLFVVIISQVIGAGFLSIISFFFGSSAGSGGRSFAARSGAEQAYERIAMRAIPIMALPLGLLILGVFWRARFHTYDLSDPHE